MHLIEDTQFFKSIFDRRWLLARSGSMTHNVFNSCSISNIYEPLSNDPIQNKKFSAFTIPSCFTISETGTFTMILIESSSSTASKVSFISENTFWTFKTISWSCSACKVSFPSWSAILVERPPHGVRRPLLVHLRVFDNRVLCHVTVDSKWTWVGATAG